MKFKTCIFKTSEVEVDATYPGLSPRDALKCFNWINSHKYNWQKEVFERPRELTPSFLSHYF